MPEKKSEKQTIWVICSSCGQKHRNHRVLFERVKHFQDEPDGPEVSRQYHRLVECMGCESIKYVTSSLDPQDYGFVGEPEESNFVVYPDAPINAVRRPGAIASDDAVDGEGNRLIPESVWKMYRETIEALSANIRTLAGGGLRAVVEAICLDSKIASGTLQNKIDELAKRGLLTTTQAELLHEERYLGNKALHELATPSAQDIEDGLGIVEGLINTIYVLPAKAARLKKRRQDKGTSDPSPS